MGLTENWKTDNPSTEVTSTTPNVIKTYYPPTKKDCQQVTVFVAIFSSFFSYCESFLAELQA